MGTRWSNCVNKSVEPASMDHQSHDELCVAAKWISEADCVLICAGAGMSLNESFNVYVSPEDFKTHYPWFPRPGYTTAYECMGLFGDRKVSVEAKWGFWAKHMDNMRWRFPVPAQYSTLLEMVRHKDSFVYTSNVDGCFARAGFATERIYTPQGDWEHYQCLGPCRPDSVFKSRPMLLQILPLVSEEGLLPTSSVPVCPNCGGVVFGNVRGGDWFIHSMYDDANRRFVDWVEAVVASKRKLVVIEVGAGFNTPTVTRFPMEAIVREMSDAGASLVRLNPSHHEVPANLPHAVGLLKGCGALIDIHDQIKKADVADLAAAEDRIATRRKEHASKAPNMRPFDWRAMIQNLRNGP